MRVPFQFLIDGGLGISFAVIALIAERVLFARITSARSTKLQLVDENPFRSGSRRPMFLSRASNQG